VSKRRAAKRSPQYEREPERQDPEIWAKYQVWQFYYASGTPVLVNALELRDSLVQTVHAVDPKDHDAGPKRIVVLGHSMGGVISHTLVSSSHNQVWASVFRVPPSRLEGDRNTIRELEHLLFFQRNPRVVRVIFMAAPHRRSPIADSFIGFMGNYLTRLSPMLEHGFSQLANVNPEALTPEAAIFYKGRFSAVRTLSPKSTALIALSKLPIEVPYQCGGRDHSHPASGGAIFQTRHLAEFIVSSADFSQAAPSQSHYLQPSRCGGTLAAQPELDPPATAQSRIVGLPRTMNFAMP
jgi:hypothetical protein